MESARERARAGAAARAKKPNTNARLSNMQGGQGNAIGNSLSFFREEADGLKLSPYSVMVICLLYIGAVVLCHILSKVRTPAGGSGPKVEDPGEGGDL